MTSRTDQPTQRARASLLGVTQPTIHRHIHKTLNKNKKVKGLVHALSSQNIAVRKARSFELYKILNNQKWKKIMWPGFVWQKSMESVGFITSEEMQKS